MPSGDITGNVLVALVEKKPGQFTDQVFGRNEKVKEHYYAESLPLLIYADAQGLPYAGVVGYQGGGTFHYLSLLDVYWKSGRERDRLHDLIGMPRILVQSHREMIQSRPRANRDAKTLVGRWVDEYARRSHQERLVLFTHDT